MGYLDKYRRLSEINGLTEQDQLLNSEIENFKIYVKSSPNRYNLKVNSIIDFEGTIQDVSFNDKKTLDEKLLCTYNEVAIKIGDYISWNDEEWLVIFKDRNTIKSHQSFIIRPCNYNLVSVKWLKDNEVVSYKSIIQNYSMYTDGTQEEKYMTSLDTKVNIMITANENTNKLKRDDRLLINQGAYKITQIDNYSNKGILSITAKETELTDNDNKELGIADYYNNQHTYNLTLLTSDKITISSTLQTSVIKVSVTDNNVIMDNPIISYLSSNESVAKVDTNGVVSYVGVGTCNITVSCYGVTKVIPVECVNTTIKDTVSYALIPTISTESFIKVTTTETFKTVKYVNGVEQFPSEFEIDVDISNLSNTDKIEIVDISAYKQLITPLTVTRNSVTVSPLVTYNPKDLSIIQANQLVSDGYKTNNYFGDICIVDNTIVSYEEINNASVTQNFIKIKNVNVSGGKKLIIKFREKGLNQDWMTQEILLLDIYEEVDEF